MDAQSIILDENFDDWETDVISYLDKKGDGNLSGIDFTNIKFSNDERYFFVFINLTKEINIQEENKIAVYIDIDDNLNTGFSKNGIGADLVYNFGLRKGQIYRNSNVFDIFHDDIGLITSPTVTSDRFEMSIARNINLGNILISMSNKIKFVISDETFNGDKAPDNISGYEYNFDNKKIFEPIPFSQNKKNQKDLRVMSYNVLKDNLFVPALRQNYKRIFQALNPEIIGFCEIYDNSGEKTAALIESFLPSTNTQKWYHASVNPDIRIVSRYPITNARSIDGNGAFHINLGEKQLLFIVAHLPCCSKDGDRQAEVDKIMAFVRSVKFGISPFNLPQNSPIIIVGDMNFVGKRQQLATFLTGDIVNNTSYGIDFSPDWDHTDLDDAKPVTTNMPFTFTWFNNAGSYSAGRLDYVIYTGSQISLSNSFALWSPSLSNAELNTFGLQRVDVPVVSDHLPVIADFDLERSTSVLNENTDEQPFYFVQSNGQIILHSKYTGNLLITDISGRIFMEAKKETPEELILDLSEIKGLIVFSFTTNDGIYSTKFYR